MYPNASLPKAGWLSLLQVFESQVGSCLKAFVLPSAGGGIVGQVQDVLTFGGVSLRTKGAQSPS